MNTPCDTCEAKDQCIPWGKEYLAADGVWIKEMRIPEKETLILQHSHAYDHTSFIAKGSVSFEGIRVNAPYPIFIKAGVKHSFLTLEADTLILCIHNVSRTGEVEVLEEHTHMGGH
jgi:hypothetical protein